MTETKREPHPCDDLPPGTWVWWCQHNRILEQLNEPACNRLAYIRAEKTRYEQVIRLACFRPVLDQQWATPADEAYEAATAPADEVLTARFDAEYPALAGKHDDRQLIFDESTAQDGS